MCGVWAVILKYGGGKYCPHSIRYIEPCGNGDHYSYFGINDKPPS